MTKKVKKRSVPRPQVRKARMNPFLVSVPDLIGDIVENQDLILRNARLLEEAIRLQTNPVKRSITEYPAA